MSEGTMRKLEQQRELERLDPKEVQDCIAAHVEDQLG